MSGQIQANFTAQMRGNVLNGIVDHTFRTTAYSRIVSGRNHCIGLIC